MGLITEATKIVVYGGIGYLIHEPEEKIRVIETVREVEKENDIIDHNLIDIWQDKPIVILPKKGIVSAYTPDLSGSDKRMKLLISAIEAKDYVTYRMDYDCFIKARGPKEPFSAIKTQNIDLGQSKCDILTISCIFDAEVTVSDVTYTDTNLVFVDEYNYEDVLQYLRRYYHDITDLFLVNKTDSSDNSSSTTPDPDNEAGSDTPQFSKEVIESTLSVNYPVTEGSAHPFLYFDNIGFEILPLQSFVIEQLTQPPANESYAFWQVFDTTLRFDFSDIYDAGDISNINMTSNCHSLENVGSKRITPKDTTKFIFIGATNSTKVSIDGRDVTNSHILLINDDDIPLFTRFLSRLPKFKALYPSVETDESMHDTGSDNPSSEEVISIYGKSVSYTDNKMLLNSKLNSVSYVDKYLPELSKSHRSFLSEAVLNVLVKTLTPIENYQTAVATKAVDARHRASVNVRVDVATINIEPADVNGSSPTACVLSLDEFLQKTAKELDSLPFIEGRRNIETLFADGLTATTRSNCTHYVNVNAYSSLSLVWIHFRGTSSISGSVYHNVSNVDRLSDIRVASLGENTVCTVKSPLGMYSIQGPCVAVIAYDQHVVKSLAKELIHEN